MSDEAVCPCDGREHPRVIDNPPGRRSIAYRVGDFASFRDALLRSLPGEAALASWQPSAGDDDLALQLLDFWAYLADILTFYNERIASDAYLRTASRREIVARITALLGHRPRPALAASGKVAAISTAKASITIPKGLGIMSKASPGKPSMIVEVDEAKMIQPGGALPVELVVDDPIDMWTLLVKGAVSGIKPGDSLLLTRSDANGEGAAWMPVAAVSTEKSPSGKQNTRITWKTPVQAAQFPSGTLLKNCRLLRTVQTPLFPTSKFPDYVVSRSETHTILHLAGVVPEIGPGARIMTVSPAGQHMFDVTDAFVDHWNEQGATSPSDPTTGGAVPVMHTQLRCLPKIDADDFMLAQTAMTVVHRGFTDVGQIISDPAKTVSGSKLVFTMGGPAPSGLYADAEVFLEDKHGRGVAARVTKVSGGEVSVTVEGYASGLEAPISILYNVLPVSQGSSVPQEVLGSGDAASAGQSFVLKKSPVTYFAGGAPGSSLPFRSSIRVLVNGAPWSEVDSFVGEAPDARVFIVREDDEGKSHVLFGDGVNGARLPTGKNNVVASYRFGAGGASPDPTSLSTLLSSVSQLSSIKSPVSILGGEEQEPVEQTRRYAPLSTFAFGRAVSLDDYEAIAVSAGARRARAYYTWDDARKSALVRVVVGDDEAAVTAARKALSTAVDANVPFTVELLSKARVALGLVLSIEPGFDRDAVALAVKTALTDPEGSLFGAAARIGEPVYESEVAEVVSSVPGVREIVALVFPGGSAPAPASGPPPVKSYYGTSIFKLLEAASFIQMKSPSASGPALSRELHYPPPGGVFAPVDVDVAFAEEGGDHA